MCKSIVLNIVLSLWSLTLKYYTEKRMRCASLAKETGSNSCSAIFKLWRETPHTSPSHLSSTYWEEIMRKTGMKFPDMDFGRYIIKQTMLEKKA